VILTITPNTALDRVLFLDRLIPGRRNAVRRAVDAMGGKGTDVSLILAELGTVSVATGFTAGETGARIGSWLRDAGVTTAFVPVAGESRLNTVLIESEGDVHTTLCPEGLHVTAGDVERLTETVLAAVTVGDVVVIAGSLPDGVGTDLYANWIRAFRDRGIRVILDSSGPSLLAGASALPWALKPNREELATLAQISGSRVEPPTMESDPSRVHARSPVVVATAALAREWVSRGMGLIVASLGAHGAVAVGSDGAWYAPPLEVPVVNPAGAGDAMVAAMALGCGRDPSTPEILRAAVALASAVVMTEGTAECHRGDYERLMGQVEVESLDTE
jgi:1-phosphofructokinase family hexose kinase